MAAQSEVGGTLAKGWVDDSPEAFKDDARRFGLAVKDFDRFHHFCLFCKRRNEQSNRRLGMSLQFQN